MTQPDPATSARDIRTLSEDYQTVGADLVHDLYWHLVDRNRRVVTIDEAREYIGRLTTRFRREVLRSWLDRLAPGPLSRANSAGHEPRGTLEDARGSAPGRVDPPRVRSDLSQRTSLTFQDMGSADTADLLSRAAGVDPAGLTNAELLTRAAGRRAVGLPARRVALPKSGSPPPIGRRVDPRQPDPPGGTPSVPNDPAGNPSFGDVPSAGEALTRIVGRGPGDLPGGPPWDEIEGAYRQLAAAAPGFRRRRRRSDEPSRPELAAALHVSPATLKRACEAAGVGSHWPPIRL
jgi:hypothetical protein